MLKSLQKCKYEYDLGLSILLQSADSIKSKTDKLNLYKIDFLLYFFFSIVMEMHPFPFQFQELVFAEPTYVCTVLERDFVTLFSLRLVLMFV